MDPSARTILVFGATGIFGGRLIGGILNTTDCDVVMACRDAARLGGLRGHGARVRTVILDTRLATPDDLRATGACALIDAAGPFQGSSYTLARAAIAAGLHYIDLADARDFVAGFGALDQAAREAGVVAVCGASSTPALSTAVLDHLTQGWRRVDRVEIAISPGNRAPRGLSVVRAILSYAGRPVRVFTDGGWTERAGWGMTVRRRMTGIGPRWLSLTETPDLDIVPARYAVTQSAIFRAGLELTVLHLGLWAASLPVRAGWPPSLAPLARPARSFARLFERFGTDRGGMTVDVAGLDTAGQPAEAHWWLVAEAGDGPYVPTLPALAALRALLDGRIPAGARACVGVLPLAAIEAEFAPYCIASLTRPASPSSDCPPPSAGRPCRP